MAAAALNIPDLAALIFSAYCSQGDLGGFCHFWPDPVLSTMTDVAEFDLVAREGIEVCPYLAESKDIFEKPDKVTLELDPQKVWLLADVLGRKFNASLMDGLKAELAQANPVSPPRCGTQ